MTYSPFLIPARFLPRSSQKQPALLARRRQRCFQRVRSPSPSLVAAITFSALAQGGVCSTARFERSAPLVSEPSGFLPPRAISKSPVSAPFPAAFPLGSSGNAWAGLAASAYVGGAATARDAPGLPVDLREAERLLDSDIQDLRSVLSGSVVLAGDYVAVNRNTERIGDVEIDSSGQLGSINVASGGAAYSGGSASSTTTHSPKDSSSSAVSGSSNLPSSNSRESSHSAHNDQTEEQSTTQVLLDHFPVVFAVLVAITCCCTARGLFTTFTRDIPDEKMDEDLLLPGERLHELWLRQDTGRRPKPEATA